MTVRKDKTRGEFTMGDQLKQDQMKTKNPIKAQGARIDAAVKPSIYTDEYMQQVSDYNNSITVLNPDYTGLTVVGNVIVRCFMYEIEKRASGLIEPHTANIKVPTPSGVGQSQTVEVTVPYSLKAVIVAIPENYLLKPGTIVQLKPNAVKLAVIGDSKGGWFINPENGFIKIGKYQPEPVNDITCPDYGYVTINYSDIQCILDTPTETMNNVGSA